ncbi:hypothetical protein [Bacillus salipaludis]|uniref:hypothetical protein n=1 Tax=Bacillus salipaludis TaxID=2547811 RepID=UPI002E1E8E56|nr:hypothetical protein [Bacillus salipaludis]
MFYHSEKKKIRGWKRHKRKIERWKQDVIDLDSDYFSEYQRTYTKLWIHPFFALIRRNPPQWYNRLLLEAMIDVYLAWHQKMKAENEDFYLKIWLYDPRFIESQIVVAYRDCLGFYEHTFELRPNKKEFPYDKFYSLKNKLEKFEWQLHIDSEYFTDNDLKEYIEEGLMTETESSQIIQKAFKTLRIENEFGGVLQYSLDKGDVWVGTLK